MQAMYALQRTNLQSARAWRLKVALREVYEVVGHSHSQEAARTGLERWIAWAIQAQASAGQSVRACRTTLRWPHHTQMLRVKFHAKRH